MEDSNHRCLLGLPAYHVLDHLWFAVPVPHSCVFRVRSQPTSPSLWHFRSWQRPCHSEDQSRRFQALPLHSTCRTISSMKPFQKLLSISCPSFGSTP